MPSAQATYSSTRDPLLTYSFRDVVLKGLADDGGLFVPQEFPDITTRLKEFKSLSFCDLAVELLTPFVGSDIPRADLVEIVHRSYKRFRIDNVVKTVPVKRGNGPEVHILELFHGPTFAFKDVALQLLGNLFEYFLKDSDDSITILGATSGDTGSAALEGVRGKKNIEAFILFPTGRVSEIQQLQMTTIPDSNIHNVRVNGTFDDCQAIVKDLFGDPEFRHKHRLAAVNSINWARILAQTTYYVYSYLQNADDACSRQVVFSVPTGNFGDVLAGYYAKKMGLPVDYLVVGTNQNDILARFFATGEYHRRPVVASISPSMDISVASNFERFLYDVCDKDASLISQMMSDFKSTGKLTLTGTYLQRAQGLMKASQVDETRTRQVIADYAKDCDYLACPHSAIGIAAAIDHAPAAGSNTLLVALATAHPGKFEPAVTAAIGRSFQPPQELTQLRELPTRFLTCDARISDVADLVEARALKLHHERGLPVRPFTIKVPASSANIGPGYDVLGLAVNLYLTVRCTPVSKASDAQVTFTGLGGEGVPLDDNNLVISTAKAVLAKFDAQLPPLSIAMHNDIPFSRGLGSSSAAVIAGVLLANGAGQLGLSRQRVLDLAVEVEGHPDNVSAGVVGGLVASCMVKQSLTYAGDDVTAIHLGDEGTNLYTRVLVSDQVSVVAVVPEFELSTAKAREILPRQYNVEDVVYNMQRLSALVVALANPTPLLFRNYMQDRLHQPQRASLIPGLQQALTCADDIPGCLGVSLSGAGPTIAALAFSDHQLIGERIQACFAKENIKSTVHVLTIDRHGATTTFDA